MQSGVYTCCLRHSCQRETLQTRRNVGPTADLDYHNLRTSGRDISCTRLDHRQKSMKFVDQLFLRLTN